MDFTSAVSSFFSDIPIADVIGPSVPIYSHDGFVRSSVRDIEYKCKYERNSDYPDIINNDKLFQATYYYYLCSINDPIYSLGKKAYGVHMYRSSVCLEKPVFKFNLHFFIDLVDEDTIEISKRTIYSLVNYFPDNISPFYFIGKIDNPDNHILDIALSINTLKVPIVDKEDMRKFALPFYRYFKHYVRGTTGFYI